MEPLDDAALDSGPTRRKETKLMANILIFIAIAIIVIGIGLLIATKDCGIVFIAILSAEMILFLGYMFITTSW